MDKFRHLHKEIVVPATLDKVWWAWTTEEGLNSFFSRKTNIKLEVGGPYETLFLLDNPEGSQGGEGNRVMAIEPMKLLSFTWNAPPTMPNVRKQRTFVELRFEGLDTGETKLDLRQFGWGESEEWTAAFQYFDSAWERVLNNLKDHFGR